MERRKKKPAGVFIKAAALHTARWNVHPCHPGARVPRLSLWRSLAHMCLLIGGRGDSCSPSFSRRGNNPLGSRGHLRPLRAVAPVVDGGRDAHHRRRDEVPGDVVVLPARELALEHLHQHEVQLHGLQAHPGERRQEAEVEHAGDDGAHQLTGETHAEAG